VLATTDPFADLNSEGVREFVTETQHAVRLSTTLRIRSDEEALDSKAVSDMPRLIDYLAQQDLEGREVLLIGFTGPAGEPAANRALSLSRAELALATLREMTPAGVLTGVQMRALGLGEVAPAVCNAKASGDPANDRVEVWLQDAG
jgi:phosphate transport system substrate-binding protein